MKEVGKQVLVAVLVAVILGTGAGVWNIVMEVKELRYDINHLYGEVNEHMQEDH